MSINCLSVQFHTCLSDQFHTSFSYQFHTRVEPNNVARNRIPIFRPLIKVKTIFPPACHIYPRNEGFSSNINVSHKYWGDSHKKLEKISFFIRNQETSDSTLKIHKKISYGWNFAKNWIEPLNRWDFNMER